MQILPAAVRRKRLAAAELPSLLWGNVRSKRKEKRCARSNGSLSGSIYKRIDATMATSARFIYKKNYSNTKLNSNIHKVTVPPFYTVSS